jgi:hypothetical protein
LLSVPGNRGPLVSELEAKECKLGMITACNLNLSRVIQENFVRDDVTSFRYPVIGTKYL